MEILRKVGNPVYLTEFIGYLERVMEVIQKGANGNTCKRVDK